MQPTRKPEQIRINRYLSDCGECSRRKADELIQEGKVKINGKVVQDLSTQVTPGKDRVQVGSRTIRQPHKGAALFNKPRGVVSTLEDPQGRKCVGDFLTKHFQSYFPVGRLDYESSGLLLLTNDGDLANRLLHPRYGFDRIYEVRVRGYVRDKEQNRLRKGLKLDDGFVKAKRIKIDETREGFTCLTITVSEGKNRLVRRMFDAVGHPVVRLKRVQHGPIRLGNLQGGQIRRLTDREFHKLQSQVLKSIEENKGSPSRKRGV